MKFTEEHEWLRIEDDVVVVGITQHASTQLGDIVFVELPEEGQTPVSYTHLTLPTTPYV